MNVVVERTRMKYRSIRERACYSIFDIEFALKTIAWEGLIWCLQEMPDTTKAEEVLINYYLYEFRENQIYDDYPFNNNPSLINPKQKIYE